jgi:hypothetical protein
MPGDQSQLDADAYRTLADPVRQGEGGIDPLGLATPADPLA